MKKPEIILICLIIFVLFIGSVGVFYNYGMLTGGTDETLKINSTLKFFRDFSIRDKYSTFFPVTIILTIPFVALMLLGYLILGFGGINKLQEIVIVDTYKFVPYFRIANVILGTITVFIFYKICENVFKDKKSAALGAYFLATSLIFVEQLHIAGAWVSQTFLILLSIYFFLHLHKKEKWSFLDFVISGLLIVFAIEIELVGAIVILPFFIIYFKKRREIKIPHDFYKILTFFLVIIIGVILFTYLSPATFKNYFSLAARARNLGLSQSADGLDFYNRIFGFFKIFLTFDPFLFILTVFGIIYFFKKLMTDKIFFKENFVYFLIFSSYGFFYYFMLGPIMGGVAERRALPLVPVLSYFAVFFISEILSKHKELKKVLYVCLAVFLINPFLFDYILLKKPSSLVLAREFIYKNIPADSAIYDECWLELNENKEILQEIAKNYPSLLTTKRQYILNHPALIQNQKNFFAVRETDIADNLGPLAFKYLIICYYSETEKEAEIISYNGIFKDKIFDSSYGYSDKNPFSMLNLANFYDFKNSGIFRLFKADHYGPRIEIYKLGK